MPAEKAALSNRFKINIVSITTDKTVDKLIDQEINHISDSYQSFDNTEEAINVIVKTTDQKIILLISSVFAPAIIPQIHDLRQIYQVFILSLGDSPVSKNFERKHRKINGSFDSLDSLKLQLREELRLLEATNSLISFADLSGSLADGSNAIDSDFIYFLWLKDILMESGDDVQKKKSFVDYCRQVCAGNQVELDTIDEFEQHYSDHSPLWWYTRQCFVQKILNSALRSHSFAVLCKMDFFIRALYQQIMTLHMEQPNSTRFIVYRGQGMLQQEFKKLQKKRGQLISFNDLLSASPDRGLSMRSAEKALRKDDLVPILFEIEIDTGKIATPFAFLDGISYFPQKSEFLFFIHSIFRIRHIEQMNNRIWKIELQSTDGNDPELIRLKEFMRKEIRGPNTVHRLASYMMKNDQWDIAKDIYEYLLAQVPSPEPKELGFIEYSLGFIDNQKSNLVESLNHFQKSLALEMQNLPNDHPQLLPTYTNIADVYRKQGSLELALENYRRALAIELKSNNSDRQRLAKRYVDMGSLLRELGRFDEARKSFKAALKIQIDILPAVHPDLAESESQIFHVSYSMRDYSTALEHARNSLTIAEQLHSPNSIRLAVVHNNISAALEKLGRNTEAMQEAQKALKIARKSLPQDDPGLQVFTKSLSILQSKAHSVDSKS